MVDTISGEMETKRIGFRRYGHLVGNLKVRGFQIRLDLSNPRRSSVGMRQDPAGSQIWARPTHCQIRGPAGFLKPTSAERGFLAGYGQRSSWPAGERGERESARERGGEGKGRETGVFFFFLMSINEFF
jgi:hypothetical protein